MPLGVRTKMEKYHHATTPNESYTLHRKLY